MYQKTPIYTIYNKITIWCIVLHGNILEVYGSTTF